MRLGDEEEKPLTPKEILIILGCIGVAFWFLWSITVIAGLN